MLFCLLQLHYGFFFPYSPTLYRIKILIFSRKLRPIELAQLTSSVCTVVVFAMHCTCKTYIISECCVRIPGILHAVPFKVVADYKLWECLSFIGNLGRDVWNIFGIHFGLSEYFIFTPESDYIGLNYSSIFLCSLFNGLSIFH